MHIKRVVWGGLFACTLSIAAATFADTVTGSAGAAFQSWLAANLNQIGNPYWDNTSIDGDNRNVGFYLTDATNAPLTDAPGALPFWGNTFNSGTDSGGTADQNFFFQGTGHHLEASLRLEVAGKAGINEFGWYDIANPLVLNSLFLGPDTPVTNAPPFIPSSQYGFYLKSSSDGTFYTQSSLNAGDETNHQHFVVFQESAVTGAEVYWIGIEDLTAAALGGNESGVGDYNDMLIRINLVSLPEPSTAALVLSGTLLSLGLLRRRR